MKLPRPPQLIRLQDGPTNPHTLAALILLAALLVAAVARGQYCPGGQCQQGWVGIGAGVSYGPAEHIVQQSGWPDKRIVLLADGGTASFVSICDKPFLISCKHKSARADLAIGEKLGFRCDDGSTGTAEVVELGDGDCSILLSPIGKLAEDVRPFRLAPSGAAVGETIYVVGFPMGRYRCRRAVVIQTGDDLQLRGTATGGESGGPIVNARGFLVGILYGDLCAQGGGSAGVTMCCGHGMLGRMIRRVEARYCPAGDSPQAEADPNPPEKREPTIDQEAWDKWQAELEELAKKTAADRANEHSLLVKIDQRLTVIEGNQCQCGPKWDALEARLSKIEANKPTEQKPFYIRIQDPRGAAYSTEYQAVLPGQYVTLPFGPNK